jgi:hypothetical protein
VEIFETDQSYQFYQRHHRVNTHHMHDYMVSSFVGMQLVQDKSLDIYYIPPKDVVGSFVGMQLVEEFDLIHVVVVLLI